MTVIAAVVGVLLGAWLFGGRVNDLSSAVGASEKLIHEHRKKVEADFSAIRTTLQDIESQLSSTAEALGQLRGDVGDIQSVSVEPIEQEGGAAKREARESLRAHWEVIRDRMEMLAAAVEDGRTRARYARIDRRRYLDLQAALAQDDRLGDKGALFKEAVELWQQFRSGRKAPAAKDIERMKEIEAQALEGPKAA